jgi:hypothetical protein
MNHLEELVYEYYDWKGYLVKRNVKVGKRPKGGYEMELDIIAYNPHEKHLIHVESSLDALSWENRKQRYSKKFEIGQKYIFKEVFTWLDEKQTIDKLIISSRTTKNGIFGQIKIIAVDDFMTNVIKEIKKEGKASKNAIPEQYPLLRTVQYCFCGYNNMPD